MLSKTVREPDRDIEAQITALCDPSHPKDTVFLAPANVVTRALPARVQMIRREEGVLLTTDAAKARHFREQRELSEGDMAEILGYPESKSNVIAEGDGVVVQARDGAGAVVMEAVASRRRAMETVGAFVRYIPWGGTIAILTPLEAVLRRLI